MATGKPFDDRSNNLNVVHSAHSTSGGHSISSPVATGDSPRGPEIPKATRSHPSYLYSTIPFITVVLLCGVIVGGLIAQGGNGVLKGLPYIAIIIGIAAFTTCVIFLGRKKGTPLGFKWVDRAIAVLKAFKSGE